ncbi:MAG: tetratricopeptide repeat protein [Kiritimatiellae bacterium]|nr:tetratricopeptide repeat protein [Kiritimatiellia bacterium]
MMPVLATGADAADQLAFANALFRRGMMEEAYAEYVSMVRDAAYPQDEVLFRLGEVQRRQGKKENAKRFYNYVVKEHPLSKWSDYARLNAAMLENEAPVRIALLKALDRSDAERQIRQTALYRLGEVQEQSGAAADAKDSFRKAMELDRASNTGHIAALRFVALLADEGGEDARKQALIEAANLAYDPASSDRVREEALYFSGVLNYGAQAWTNAASTFGELHRLYPNGARDAQANVYRAWAQFRAQHYADAFEAAKSIGRNSEEGLFIQAVSLAQLGRTEDSRRVCEDSIKRFPGGKYAPRLALQLMEIASKTGDHDAILETAASRGDWPQEIATTVCAFALDAAVAKEDWRKAVEWAGKTLAAAKTKGDGALAARAAFMEGIAHLRMEDLAAARRAWSEALAIAPDSVYAAQALEARAAAELKGGETLSSARSYAELATRFPSRAAKTENMYRRAVAMRASGDAPGAEAIFANMLATANAGDTKTATDFVREAKLEMALLMQTRGAFEEASALLAALAGTETEKRIPASALVKQSEYDLERGNADAALTLASAAAKVADGADDTWKQAAAFALGAANEAKGNGDAAMAAYRKALDVPAKTIYAVKAALRLGKLESKAGRFAEANTILCDAVERARADDLAYNRMEAYAALAENERLRGDTDAELRYSMLVLTLFDNPDVVPGLMERAAEILRAKGRADEADKLIAERKARYGE